MFSRRLVVLILTLATWTHADPERGLMFNSPYDGDWSRIGAYIGGMNYWNRFQQLPPATLKISHGHIQHFCPQDATRWALFPYQELKEFEAAEIAASRDPIFISVTTPDGVKRPVYWDWSLGLTPVDGAIAPKETDQTLWMQAVNIRDDRFIRFWVDKYVRAHWAGHSMPNLIMGADNFSLRYDHYRYINAQGAAVLGGTWDKPFAQNEEEFNQSFSTFLRRLHDIAPDITVMVNLIGPKSYPRLLEIAPELPAQMHENLYPTDTSSSARTMLYYRYLIVKTAVDAGKYALLRFYVPERTPAAMRSTYVLYQLNRGEKTFHHFAYPPTVPDDPRPEVPEADYADLKRILGRPTGPLQNQHVDDPARDVGYRLYWRECEGGIVYFNLTGMTQQITLPPDRVFRNANGTVIQQITLPDVQGEYVLVDNASPTVTLSVAPAWLAPADVKMSATADDQDGHVVKVQFYEGSNFLGEDIDGADGWQFTWRQEQAGTYHLTARAVDNRAAEATSALVSISVQDGPHYDQARITLTKQVAPLTPQPLELITLTIRYHNAGNSAATNVQIVDDMPLNLSNIVALDGGSYDPQTRRVTWHVPSVGIDVQGQVRVRARMP